MRDKKLYRNGRKEPQRAQSLSDEPLLIFFYAGRDSHQNIKLIPIMCVIEIQTLE